MREPEKTGRRPSYDYEDRRFELASVRNAYLHILGEVAPKVLDELRCNVLPAYTHVYVLSGRVQRELLDNLDSQPERVRQVIRQTGAGPDRYRLLRRARRLARLQRRLRTWRERWQLRALWCE